MISNVKEGAQQEEDRYYISADTTYSDDRTQELNHFDTFGIFSRSGDILPHGKEVQGLYHCDTRYINRLKLKLNNIRPTLLSSAVKEENEILSVDLTNPEMVLDNGELLHHGTVHIRRSQFVGDGLFHEKIELENHNVRLHKMDLALEFGGDFKDIFEVRGLRRNKRGNFEGYEHPTNKSITFSYIGLDDVTRKARITFSQDIDEIENRSGKVGFHLQLNPKELISLEYCISCEDENKTSQYTGLQDARAVMEPHLEKARSYFPTIETSNQHFTHWINRSKTDLISLMADTPYGKYPYAGVPWYNTAFGRDGLITALETLWAAPNLSKDVLLFLAAKQADINDEDTDAEPGKILHETRGGEMVALNEVPFKQYYGTIDATMLFVFLAGEYFNRTADLDTIKKIWPNIVRAIDWVNDYGDLDGDGFVEYKHKAKNGLTNQGWKDSHDSVFYDNGELAEPPIALCEVQAYTYGAKVHAANLARILGEKKLAESWASEAKELKDKFNDVFWDKNLECYILALDGNKKACRVKSSNAGQVLFTGIADPGKARKLVKTLMKPDMYSGWGIRTLSSEEAKYNPMSYHNGTIWPHDVALIAYGMSKYGYHVETLELMKGLFDASLFVNMQRLPELFCGMGRREGEGPTAYPVACSPQAWSVAAVYMLLQSVLQINISRTKKEISFHKPILPSYLESINIKNLSIGETGVDIEITRNGGENMIAINWVKPPEGWKLIVVK